MPEWVVVSLPALAEDGDPLGRPLGAALCPERYALPALDDFRAVLGARSFDALYQQRPRPAEGAMFKRHWFEIVPAAPAAARRVRYWDLAGADVGKGDYTAGVRMALDTGTYYIEDLIHGQWSAHPRNTLIRTTAELEPRIPVYIEQAPGLAKEATDALIKLLAGFIVHADPVHRDKVTRGEPFAAQCEAGNVKLVRGPWNAVWLDELCDVPFGAHDDIYDGSTGAFNKLATAVKVAVTRPKTTKPNMFSEVGDARITRDRQDW